MCRFDELPTTAFAQICQNLDNLQDIFNLQSTNKSVRQRVRRVFWSLPRRLQLSDTQNAFLYTNKGQAVRLPANVEAIRNVCRQAPRLSEFDLSSDCEVEERFLVGVVEVIRVEVKVVTSLRLSYFNPDLMYSIKRQRYQSNNVNDDEIEKRASPSLSTHKKICRLISTQNQNLRLLHIRLDSSGLLAIGRDRPNELHVEFGGCDCTQNVMLMLHQVFSGYTSVNTPSSHQSLLRLGLNFSDVDKLKQAFLFCTHNAFPAEQKLKEIHCRVPSEPFTLQFDFNELRAGLRETLRKVVWHVEDWENTTPTSLKTLIRELHLPQFHENEQLNVSRPKNKRNRPMIVPNLFPIKGSESIASPLRCVS